MHRKLVELDDESLRFTEVDRAKIYRTAVILRQWLLLVDPNNDCFNYLKLDLPIVEAAINGTLRLPYKGSEPHILRIIDGSLPREYIEISSPFYNAIRGQHMVRPEVIEKDGKRFAWMTFEDIEDVQTKGRA